ncbi:MAG: HAD-IG family 5'-nucleotidase [Deltaproteobacteria bacterium]
MTAEQLALPQIDTYLQEPSLYKLAHDKRVWVNRSLRMDQIEWVGFDMDYTLAIYNQTEIDKLSVAATVKKLVARGYPPELADVNYAYDFPVRGLLIDKRFGHLLKMDRYKFVGKGYHGMRELTHDERRNLYHARKVRPVAPRYHWIDTLYALPEAALYAGAVDLLDRLGTAVDYSQLFQDIRECIDEAHRDGAIVDVIQHDLPRFVMRDLDLAATLHKLRSAGKRLFLLTNSRWGYTESMMKYLLEGMMTEYPSWRNFFDVTVVAASKPAFFQERRPFMERIGEVSQPATRLERGHIYEGGNLRDFERLIHSGGDAVLYVGDHIYGDILRSKKESAWRTAMIVQEMVGESVASEGTRGDLAQLDSNARQRDRLEDELRFCQARLKAIVRALEERGIRAAPSSRDAAGVLTLPRVGAVPGASVDAATAPLSATDEEPRSLLPVPLQVPDNIHDLEAERVREKRGIERIRGALRELDDASRKLQRQADRTFHPYWGSIFKQGVELSSFGDQVETYACLYTARVSNFLLYSPLHYFHSPRDYMPHELP